MKSREKELLAMGNAPASTLTSSEWGGLSDAQFEDLKESILRQFKQEKAEESSATSSLDLMHVVESGLGYMAGKAVVGLMGKSPLEQKLDYLIQLLQQPLQARAGIGVVSKSMAMKPMGMVSPTTKPAILNTNAASKALKPNVVVPKTTSSGLGMPMPENAKSNPPTNPFFKDGLMM